MARAPEESEFLWGLVPGWREEWGQLRHLGRHGGRIRTLPRTSPTLDPNQIDAASNSRSKKIDPVAVTLRNELQNNRVSVNKGKIATNIRNLGKFAKLDHGLKL